MGDLRQFLAKVMEKDRFTIRKLAQLFPLV